jgi:glycosyltransferase involved in cell wall biosynthesis
MKIAFLAGTLGRGGAERQLIYMLRAAIDKNIEARVLCLTKGEAFEEDITQLGIDVDWVGDSQNNFARLGKILVNLRKRPVDIIQSVHFYTNFYAASAGRILSIPSIGAIRNDLTSEIAANGFFGRWHLKLPKKLVANSTLAVERAITRGIDPSKLAFVRNVVNGSNANGHHQLNTEDRIKILFAGRLVPQKRPKLFVELAARLRSALPQKKLQFLIAGDGPLRLELENGVQKLGLASDYLQFLGETNKMAEVYKTCDILVLTSEHEGTPNVILEAMAHGLPVVATKVGGVPQVLNGECGMLVEFGNSAALDDAVTRLILDRDLRVQMGTSGREYVGKNHSISYLQERLASIYSELAATTI